MFTLSLEREPKRDHPLPCMLCLSVCPDPSDRKAGCPYPSDRKADCPYLSAAYLICWELEERSSIKVTSPPLPLPHLLHWLRSRRKRGRRLPTTAYRTGGRDETDRQPAQWGKVKEVWLLYKRLPAHCFWS